MSDPADDELRVDAGPAAALPDADAALAHVRASRPRPIPLSLTLLPLAVLVVLAVMSVRFAGSWVALVPLAVVVIAVIVLHRLRARMQQSLALLQEARDRLTLHQPHVALRILWPLLPRLRRTPVLGAGAVALADALALLDQHEAALALLDEVDDGDGAADSPPLIAIALNRCMLELRTDRIGDATATLNRARAGLATAGDAYLHAAFHTTQLAHALKTGHARSGVDEAPQPVALFRGLGNDAGRAHLLLAACHARLDQPRPALAALQRAELLLPAERLRRSAADADDDEPDPYGEATAYAARVRRERPDVVPSLEESVSEEAPGDAVTPGPREEADGDQLNPADPPAEHPEADARGAHGTNSNGDPAPPQPPTLPPFEETIVRNDRLMDGIARVALGIAVFLAVVLGLGSGSALIGGVALFAVLAILFGQGLQNARTMRQAQLLRAVVAAGAVPLAVAAQRLEALRRRRGLGRSVRTLLELAWAQIAEQQQNPREAARIARHLLQRHLGSVEPSRPDLLLLLARTAIDCRELDSASGALITLRATPLPLMSRFEALVLEVQYRLLCGDDAGLVRDLPHYTAVATDMPGPRTALLHAMLARAVERRRAALSDGSLDDLHAWLHARLQLLLPLGYQNFLATRGLAPKPA